MEGKPSARGIRSLLRPKTGSSAAKAPGGKGDPAAAAAYESDGSDMEVSYKKTPPAAAAAAAAEGRHTGAPPSSSRRQESHFSVENHLGRPPGRGDLASHNVPVMSEDEASPRQPSGNRRNMTEHVGGRYSADLPLLLSVSVSAPVCVLPYMCLCLCLRATGLRLCTRVCLLLTWLLLPTPLRRPSRPLAAWAMGRWVLGG